MPYTVATAADISFVIPPDTSSGTILNVAYPR